MLFHYTNYSHEKMLKPASCYLWRVTILRHARKIDSWPREIVMEWDLPFELYVKWSWYIEYRWALAKVATPNQYVEVKVWWHEKEDSAEILKRLEEKRIADAIRAKKAQVTKIENIMAQAKAEWTSFLPIEEDPLWIKALGKLEQKRCELKEFLTSINK